jgi:hypothetical protein
MRAMRRGWGRGAWWQHGMRQGVQRIVGDAGERVALAWQRDVSRISAAEVQT